MYRNVEKDLLRWKKIPNKKALFITGARQVGKTYSIREFGRNNYANFVEINFIDMPEAKKGFEGSLRPEHLYMWIGMLSNRALTQNQGSTLIFLDEIQECPQARTAIKFLVEDGRFDYIESGSLLGVSYKNVPSYPVGYEHHLSMYPMDFYEFCCAWGISQEVFDYLETCYRERKTVEEGIHGQLLNLFRYYVLIGGMPDPVQTFIDFRDVVAVTDKQKTILQMYRQDIRQYVADGNLQKRIEEVFDRLPAALAEKNRRFKIASLGKSARLREYEDAFLWLRDAGVALPCYNLSEPRMPLKLNEKSSLFKLFLSDTGLLCTMSFEENIQFKILSGDLSVNMGSILENAFAQELVAHGFKLRYFNRHGIGELDFVVQQGGEVAIVEIKSGEDYRTHAALNNALKIKEWGIKKALVFCKGNVAQEGAVTYLPWYMTMFFKPESQMGSEPDELDSRVINQMLNHLPRES
ncbi:MAG TPA: ATP-binding protein [Candidatus Avisuccinivibrio pullicola]|nr:ATP-binding protein [Candidatus Avisuccinivibrio pullicola]